jgi:hypothetical protein
MRKAQEERPARAGWLGQAFGTFVGQPVRLVADNATAGTVDLGRTDRGRGIDRGVRQTLGGLGFLRGDRGSILAVATGGRAAAFRLAAIRFAASCATAGVTLRSFVDADPEAAQVVQQVADRGAAMLAASATGGLAAVLLAASRITAVLFAASRGAAVLFAALRLANRVTAVLLAALRFGAALRLAASVAARLTAAAALLAGEQALQATEQVAAGLAAGLAAIRLAALGLAARIAGRLAALRLAALRLAALRLAALRLAAWVAASRFAALRLAARAASLIRPQQGVQEFESESLTG